MDMSELRKETETCPEPDLPIAPELRQKIVDLARAGRNAASLAREFEPTETTIRNWIAQADRDAGVRSDGLTTDERKELNQLQTRESHLARRARNPKKSSGVVRAGDRRDTTEVFGYMKSPGRSAHHRHDESGAGGLPERVLRVGGSAAFATVRERMPSWVRPYPEHPRAVAGDLRGPADPRGVVRQREARGTQAGGPPDAWKRHPGRMSAQVDDDDRAGSHRGGGA